MERSRFRGHVCEKATSALARVRSLVTLGRHEQLRRTRLLSELQRTRLAKRSADCKRRTSLIRSIVISIFSRLPAAFRTLPERKTLIRTLNWIPFQATGAMPLGRVIRVWFGVGHSRRTRDLDTFFDLWLSSRADRVLATYNSAFLSALDREAISTAELLEPFNYKIALFKTGSAVLEFLKHSPNRFPILTA